MFKIILPATAALLIAATAHAGPRFNTEIGTNVQTAIAVDSSNVALGEDAVALQAFNNVCGSDVGTNVQTAIAVDSYNVSIGDNAVAMQATNLVGGTDCLY